MRFIPVKFPIPYWSGPYSPAAGKMTGMRVRKGYAGAWCDTIVGLKFFHFEKSNGADSLSSLVKVNFNDGGRIVILPNGYVIKPENDKVKVGYQRLIGKIKGEITIPQIYENFVLGPTSKFEAGSKWKGPHGGAIRCTIKDDGSIHTKWSVPNDKGASEYKKQLTGPNLTLLSQVESIEKKIGAKGRVYYWYGGHLTTADHQLYIGKVACNTLDANTDWFEEEN